MWRVHVSDWYTAKGVSVGPLEQLKYAKPCSSLGLRLLMDELDHQH